MKEGPFEFWAAQLEELTPAEEKEVARLEWLGRKPAQISLNNRAAALMMRYNFDRWQLIMKKLEERLRTAD